MFLSIGPTWADGPVIVGRFLSHAPDTVIRIDEQGQGQFGGWQTSDLTYDAQGGRWWSICDQNGRETPRPVNGSHQGRYAYLVTSVADAQVEPIPIWWDQRSEFDAVRKSFEGVGTGYIDFEGIAADPTQANRFFACTEGPEPWIVEMEYRPHDDPAQRRMAAIRTVRISMQGNHRREANDFDPNAVWEGIAVSPDGTSIYLATEWTGSSSRIHRLATADVRGAQWKSENGALTAPKVVTTAVPVSIAGSLTGLAFATRAGKPCLIALERNVPALHFIDLDHTEATESVTLDLRAPATDGRAAGIEIRSASPEGIAVDDQGTLALIGDPDKKFFFALTRGIDAGSEAKMDNLIPLVFTARLDDLLP